MVCKRERCSCEAQKDRIEGYCSEACRAGRIDATGRCACGHSEC